MQIQAALCAFEHDRTREIGKAAAENHLPYKFCADCDAIREWKVAGG